MLDLANYRSLKEQFATLRGEVEKFSPELAKRDFAIALTRMDAAENLQRKVGEFLQILGLRGEQSKIKGEATGKFNEGEYPKNGGAGKTGKNLFYKQDIYKFDGSKPYFVMPISSATNQNIAELKFSLLELLKKENFK